MNFARLVHILYSIRPYEKGFIKQFKHKDQCPIYNASPIYFGKFLFSWKPYFNLYLKWAMALRSPHLFFLDFLYFIFLYFFWKKMWPNFISKHQSLLFVLLQSSSWMFTLLPREGLTPSLKSLVHLNLSFSNGPCP